MSVVQDIFVPNPLEVVFTWFTVNGHYTLLPSSCQVKDLKHVHVTLVR